MARTSQFSMRRSCSRFIKGWPHIKRSAWNTAG